MIPRSGWLLLLPLAVAAGLVVPTLGQVRYQPGADEGYYLRYASRIADEGLGVFPRLFQEHMRDARNAYFPPPLRIGGLAVSAAWVSWFGGSFRAISILSLVCFLLLLALHHLNLLRFFGWRAALFASLLLSTAPLHLAMSRRGLMDTLSSLLMVSSLWVLFHALHSARWSVRRGLEAAAVTLAAFSVKATSFMLIPVSAALLGWSAVRRRGSFPAGVFVSFSVLPLAVLALLEVLAAGGVGPLREAIRFGQAAYGSPYAQTYLQGPWYRYVMDFLLISPWTTLLYLVGLGMLAGARVEDEKVWFWAAVPLLVLACAVFFPLRNVRYLMMLEVPVRTSIALVCSRWGGLKGVVPVILLFWADMMTFSELVGIDLYEMPSIEFLMLRGIIR